MLRGRPAKPLVLATANGDQYRNGGSQTCVERAFAGIARGEDVLDALVAKSADYLRIRHAFGSKDKMRC